jgi:hypothetical protein
MPQNVALDDDDANCMSHLLRTAAIPEIGCGGAGDSSEGIYRKRAGERSPRSPMRSICRGSTGMTGETSR